MGHPQILIAGLALTFARADATQMRLTVSLTQPTPVALQWGATTRTSSAARHHEFSGLPVTEGAGLEYVLRAGSEVVARRVAPIGTPERLLFGVLGDGGEGSGPRSVLLDRLTSANLHAVIAIGDPLGWLGVDAERRMRALPLTTQRPVVLVGAGEAPKIDDPHRDRSGLPAHVYHLRLGATLVWVLDDSLGFGGAQGRFVRATHDAFPDARWRVMVMRHGPVSSGPRGGHPDRAALWRLVNAAKVDVVISGQDRIYERLVRGSTTVIVSGASGARVDPRRRVPDETQAFVSAPHWVRLALGVERAELTAHGIEGALIDRAPIPPAQAAPRPVPWRMLSAAAGALLLGLVAVAVSLLRAGTRPG